MKLFDMLRSFVVRGSEEEPDEESQLALAALDTFHHRLDEELERAVLRLQKLRAFATLPEIFEEIFDEKGRSLKERFYVAVRGGMTAGEFLDLFSDPQVEALLALAAERFFDKNGWPALGDPLHSDAAAAGLLLRLSHYREAAVTFARKAVDEGTIDLHQLPRMITAAADLGAYLERLSLLEGSSSLAQEAIARSHMEVVRRGGQSRGRQRASQADKWRVPALAFARERRQRNPNIGDTDLARRICERQFEGAPAYEQVLRTVSGWVRTGELLPSTHRLARERPS